MRGDRVGAVVWMALGLAIVVGGWQMDRLERFQIKPYEVPGLVPGLLGAVLAALGVALWWRSSRQARQPDEADDAAPVTGRAGPADGRATGLVPIAIVLSLGYALGLLGSGLPFWAATAVYVAAFIVALDGARQRALGRRVAAVAARATGFGVIVGAAVEVLFRQVFLVNLP